MAKRKKRKKAIDEISEPKADNIKADKDTGNVEKERSEDSENKEFFEEKTEFPIFNKIKRHFENKSFKFIFLFLTLIISFYILFLLFIDKISFVMEFIAGNIGFLLNLFGINAKVNGTLISMENFSMKIIFECTPVFTTLIYFACILAYPAKPNAKIKGMIFGGILIYFIDLIRLFSLAIIGNISPEIFNYIHTYLWQITLIIVILAIWLFWLRNLSEPQPKRQIKMKFTDLKINLNSESKKVFLIKFLIISTLLFLLYILIAGFLFSATLNLANLIMVIFGYGYKLTLESNEDLSNVLINLNIMVYIALILATPKIKEIIKNRIYFLILGSILLFFINATIMAGYAVFLHTQGEISYLYITFFITFGQAVIPFVLWFAMAHRWFFGNFTKI